MDLQLEKIISQNSIHFDQIVEGINRFGEFRDSDENLSSDDTWKINIDCVNSLTKLTEMCLAYGKFKDTWDYDTFYPNHFGPELIIKSKKTGCDYNIGLNERGMYLSTDLRYNENLRYMDDDFWKTLLSLSELEGFDFQEYERTSDKQRKQFPELFKSNKSMLFRILRKHFFDQTSLDEQYSSSSVGEFRIYWTSENSFEIIARNCCVAFKTMYQLNYKLWKVTDLKEKSSC